MGRQQNNFAYIDEKGVMKKGSGKRGQEPFILWPSHGHKLLNPIKSGAGFDIVGYRIADKQVFLDFVF